ncbi:MAG: hypothetical protein ABIQ72_02030 [Usitatibacter sp.]
MRIAHPERLLLLLVIAGVSLPAFAAVDIGTLFYTAEERARLDRLRRGDPQVVEGVVAAPAYGPREVTGFVKRSDGRSTLWIDGIAVPATSPRARALLDPKTVRGGSRGSNAVKVERRPPS